VRVVDRMDAGTLSSISMSGDEPIGKGIGLAVDPLTGALWGLLENSSVFGRSLVRINPADGSVDEIGPTGDYYSGMAFNGAGRLFLVAGDGAGYPETLFTVNRFNARPEFLLKLGNGDQGKQLHLIRTTACSTTRRVAASRCSNQSIPTRWR
jgi:hypothetical protein